MLDFERLHRDLSGFATEEWLNALGERSRHKLSDSSHGHLAEWRDVLNTLPEVGRHAFDLNKPALPSVFHWRENSMPVAREKLLKLVPWRKGPFDIGGIEIDSEWRSDLKWERLRHAISPLSERRVLDVGCGNGYYALRMIGDGAKLVLGIDPTVLFVVQFAAIRHFMINVPVYVLPLRLHELPPSTPQFDSVFSMGVLYHQRDALLHLAQLKETLRADGELILETLIAPGKSSDVVVPVKRYARMRNVWHLPTAARLGEWLADAGFTDIRIVDETRTTVEEQRTTEWMPYESLSEALDPIDSELTIEGLPAPLRQVVVCRKAAD